MLSITFLYCFIGVYVFIYSLTIIYITKNTLLKLVPVLNINTPSKFNTIITKLNINLKHLKRITPKIKRNNLEQAVYLSNWLRQNSPILKNENTSEDAEIIIKNIKKKSVVCGGLAIALTAILQANGYKSRILFLTENYISNTLDTHMTTEVFIPNLKKWVVIDPTFNCYWTHKEIPLSAIEIQKYNKTGNIHLKKKNNTAPHPNTYYLNPFCLFKNIFILQEVNAKKGIFEFFKYTYFKKPIVYYSNNKKICYSNMLRIYCIYLIPIILIIMTILII